MGETCRIIVSGSRSFKDFLTLCKVLDSVVRPLQKCYDIEIVTGDARGSDLLTYGYAKCNSFKIHIMRANWERHGRSAGYIRNSGMLKYALEAPHNLLVAFWDGESKGTYNQIEICKKAGMTTIVYNFIEDKASMYKGSEPTHVRETTEGA